MGFYFVSCNRYSLISLDPIDLRVGKNYSVVFNIVTCALKYIYKCIVTAPDMCALGNVVYKKYCESM